ncbi:glycerophosphodiester phosphodiesterase [Hathewaya histolytica]|uniref:Glycerophosphoryl diester phosphodiesterase family protein n=1 Tax=Hathewaya histolytica TaxID=1498 RepID=A0A4U9RBL1_HATHI|nr:glycerophosphodiester phosphodiesterase [Hathewaya histolytica]VTQ86070.1 glycerophosphoryl diester phosphodiesterase family protein [Hathewaya histolytica]
MYPFNNLLKHTFKDFKNGFYINMKFEAIYKLITAFILLPLMSMCLNYFISLSGRKTITNNELIKFSTSKEGLCAFLILCVITSISIILEIGTLIIIAKNTYMGVKISLKEAFFLSLNNLSKIFSISSISIILYITFLVPLLGIGMTSSLITSLKIPSFILDWILQYPLGITLLIMSIIIAYFLLIRWIFTMHIAILENKSFKESLKDSSNLCKGNYFYIFKNLFLSQLILWIISMLFFFLSNIAIGLIIKRIGVSSFTSLAILSLYSIIISILLLLFTLFSSPFNTIIITRLYFSLRPSYTEPSNLKYYNKDKNYMSFKTVKKNKKFVSALVLIFLSLSLALTSILSYTESQKNDVNITAHRGNSLDAPENSKSAIEYAIKDKAHYAEIDVQETKDGEVVLTHDSNFKRTADVNKYVWQTTLPEIKKFDIGSKFDPKFKGETVPTLEEIIKISKNKIKLNIEIKTHGREKYLIKKVADLIKKYNLEEQCVVTSLNYKALLEIKKLNPKIKIGYIMYIALGDLAELKVDFYSIEESNVTKDLVNKAHLIGREIHIWTIDDSSKAETLIDMGVDNIITNKPEEMLQIIEKSKNKTIMEKLLGGI